MDKPGRIARIGAALSFALLAAAAAAQPRAAVRSDWAGLYTCSTKGGVFSKPAEVFNAPLRLTLEGGRFKGSRAVEDLVEQFEGTLDLGGNVRLGATGTAPGGGGRSSGLQSTGVATPNELVLHGERAEVENGRVVRELQCMLALAREKTADDLRADERLVAAAAPPQPQPQPQPQPAAIGPASRADAPAAPAPQPASRRALVIGNDAYRHVAELRNANADARAMAEALAAMDFTVTTHLDLDEREFKQALREFRAGVQPGDEVVVFFAGHGVQLAGANYLLPVDIRGLNEEQVRDESLPLQKLLDDLAERRAGFTLAIIDACRDNPFRTATRSLAGRGLAPTTAATGQMIIFSAGSGQQALDRLGPEDHHPNGVFTRVFLGEMDKPGVTVDRMLRNVRNEVVRLARSIGHQQTPALYDQVVGDYYLKRPPAR